ncbi:MAG: cysteine-rich CWC family protein [Pseudomonadota bacterium]
MDFGTLRYTGWLADGKINVSDEPPVHRPSPQVAAAGDSRSCPVCTRPNGCGVAEAGPEAAATCWCFAAKVSRELLDWVGARGLDGHCLCAGCAAGKVPSPCVGTCRLDDTRAFCVGCGRTVDEISAWSSFGPVDKAAVLLRLRVEQQQYG